MFTKSDTFAVFCPSLCIIWSSGPVNSNAVKAVKDKFAQNS